MHVNEATADDINTMLCRNPGDMEMFESIDVQSAARHQSRQQHVHPEWFQNWIDGKLEQPVESLPATRAVLF